MEQAIQDLIASIKAAEEYDSYQRSKEKIKRQPELKRRIDEFRQKNYEIQNAGQEEDVFEKLEQLEREYGAFLEDPLVEEFLNAELAFCRMMQDMYARITDALDFE